MAVYFKIRPQEMSEGCFWVRVDEDQYAKPDLLNRVALTFGSQRTGKTLHLLFNALIYLISICQGGALYSEKAWLSFTNRCFHTVKHLCVIHYLTYYYIIFLCFL